MTMAVHRLRNPNSRYSRARPMKTTLSIEQLENKKMLSAVRTPPFIFPKLPFSDRQIHALMQVSIRDGVLNRKEIINVFRSAGDGNIVNRFEFGDLQTLLDIPFFKNRIEKDTRQFVAQMFDPTINKGNELGINSSAAKLNGLIDKWFYGKNHPTVDAGVSYNYASGQLFVNRPSETDVKQGIVGDCYFLAAVASIAGKEPEVIENMFKDNGDGTWTVTFLQTVTADIKYNHYLVVDRMLPTDSSGYACYASMNGTITGKYDDPTNELWVSLLEKAYVQLNETGITQRHTTENSYQAIAGGHVHIAYNVFYVGQVTQKWGKTLSESVLQDALKKNLPIGYSWRENYHAYYLKSYENGIYHLVNPWGYGHLQMTYTQLMAGSIGITIVPAKELRLPALEKDAKIVVVETTVKPAIVVPPIVPRPRFQS